ncbi:MAG TPA: NUDIX hydrolase [Rhizomicrobium sp.]
MEPLFREHGQQVAALCWRTARTGMLEVLLITSLGSRRWILPKGWPEREMSLADNAAREAFEEAGVSGEVGTHAIGAYPYLKERKGGGAMACSVEVFALKVKAQADDWPEKGQREWTWLPPEKAAAKVAEPGLRQILLDFRKLQLLKHAV